MGVGAYLLVKGRRESAELAEVDKQRKLLNIVLSRGQASISDLVLELGATTDQVKAWIYDLVGKGLFSGHKHAAAYGGTPHGNGQGLPPGKPWGNRDRAASQFSRRPPPVSPSRTRRSCRDSRARL